MHAENLRLLWSVVTDLSQNTFTGISDADLVKSLVSQLNGRFCLSREEQQALTDYMMSRTPLIRELLHA